MPAGIWPILDDREERITLLRCSRDRDRARTATPSTRCSAGWSRRGSASSVAPL